MSDTPETDDIARGNHVVPTEWAQQLERERNEARRKLNNLDVTAIHSCHNECQRPICVLRRERDEARELARNLYWAGHELRRFTAAYAHDYDEVDGKPGALEAISDFYDASKDIAKILDEEAAK